MFKGGPEKVFCYFCYYYHYFLLLLLLLVVDIFLILLLLLLMIICSGSPACVRFLEETSLFFQEIDEEVLFL